MTSNAANACCGSTASSIGCRRRSDVRRWRARGMAGWALLMDDVSDWLTRSTTWPAPGWQPLSLMQFGVVSSALASLHARFYCDRICTDPALALCTSAQFFTAFSPEVMSRHAECPRALVPRVQRGLGTTRHSMRLTWPAGMQVTPGSNSAGECSGAISGDARARRSQTRECRFPRRTHSADRLAVGERSAPDALTWPGCSSRLRWSSRHRGKPSLQTIAERLATRLGMRFDESTWEPQLRLALLGQCLRTMGMWLSEAYFAPTATARDMRRAQLPWWCEQARAGLKWL